MDYQRFNKFQTLFYTNIHGFQEFSNFDIKNYSFLLLEQMVKVYPVLATEIINIYVPNFIKFNECPTLIYALQRRFVNGFSRTRVPHQIFYKSMRSRTSKKKSATKTIKGQLEFSDDVKFDIKSILRMDEKTYQYLKYSEKVQDLGKQLISEFNKKELQILKK